jgi:hypothetical protein
MRFSFTFLLFVHCAFCCRLHLKCDGTRAETRFRLSAKRMSPFKSVGASVQSTTGSRGVRISGSNAGYTIFRGNVKSTGYPLHSPVSPSLPLLASQCAITFQLDPTSAEPPTYVMALCNFLLNSVVAFKADCVSENFESPFRTKGIVTRYSQLVFCSFVLVLSFKTFC